MMFRRFAFIALAASIFTGQAALAQKNAQPCRDAKGKFTKCEKPSKPAPCRDAKGKFTKCNKKNHLKSDMPMHPGMPDANMPTDNHPAQ